jgi:FtsP/CotA-like multicopper oxidase with cupredoxin domain
MAAQYQAAQLTKDTIAVNPGERYDIEFTAANPGMWMLHCHVPHHVTNNHVEPGGLMYVITFSPDVGWQAPRERRLWNGAS